MRGKGDKITFIDLSNSRDTVVRMNKLKNRLINDNDWVKNEREKK